MTRAATLLLALAAGCDAGRTPSCAETGVCAPGAVCDRESGACLPAAEAAPAWRDVGRFLSAAAAADGTVYVAARAEGPAGLVAGRIAPGADEVELRQVVPGEGAGLGTSVAVGPDGQPRIAFFDAIAVALRLATFNGTNWEVETVAAGTRAAPFGEGPALGVLPDGREVIACRDAAAGGLALATREGRAFAVALVDAPEGGPGERGGRGFHASLALPGSGVLAAHYDADGGDLRVLVADRSAWAVRVFGGAEDGDPDWGRFATAALDPRGNAGLAFAGGDGSLLVAWNDRGALLLETADDGRPEDDVSPPHIVGAFVSLAFGAGPVVAYQDGAQAVLRLAERGPEGWGRRDLDARPVAGHGVALLRLPAGDLLAVHRRLEPAPDGAWRGHLDVVRP